jgi:hypothetical protein
MGTKGERALTHRVEAIPASIVPGTHELLRGIVFI